MDNGKIFQSLAYEAQFTKEILESGITQLNKANYGQKVRYFQAFTSISTGLERIGKLCLILDNYIDNKGEFTEESFVNTEIELDLEKLFLISKMIISKRKISFYFPQKLSSPIHLEILLILSKFAKGDRYSNINLSIINKYQNDLINDWIKNIDQELFNKKMPYSKKEEIENNAKKIDFMLSNITKISPYDELRHEIFDGKSDSYLTEMTKSIIRYRQFYVLQIIRYWVEILISLQHKAMSFNDDNIPFMNDIFAIFFQNDSYLKIKKAYG